MVTNLHTADSVLSQPTPTGNAKLLLYYRSKLVTFFFVVVERNACFFSARMR